MAHSCPTCSLRCHCGGDIDDLEFDDTVYARQCSHCPDDDYGDDDFYDDGADMVADDAVTEELSRW